MLQKWLKQHLPDKKTINNHSSLNRFHNYLRHPNIWYFNCASISRGAAIGLFAAFIPLPMQMIIAALLSILFRANLPIAVVMTWITNPFTFVPINYFIYWVGAKVLGESIPDIQITDFSWQFENMSQFVSSFMVQVSKFGKAFFVGLPIVAFGMAAMGYFLVRIIWYVSIVISTHGQKPKKKQR